MTGKKGLLAWCAALLILAAALVFFNRPAADGPALGGAPAAETTARYADDAPLGYHVGERLPDFTLVQTDGSEFTLSQYRGKVTVINLWATWCTPCVNELPYFDRLQQAYSDEVKVLAIHSDLITDDPLDYLSAFDYRIAFAVDKEGGVIASMGGSAMLPQTVVLDPRGEVIYNKVGSVTYETLAELVEAAGNEPGGV